MPRLVDKRLHQHRTVAVPPLEIARHPPQSHTQHLGGQIAASHLRPDQEAAHPHHPGNGIRLVDFAIRLRIRSWALIIRWFFIPLARISHNQVENDVFHGMRGVRGMACRVASSKRLRRAGMRVFSPPFCGRDGESLSIRARGGRRAPPPASCTRLHRAFTLVPGWPRSTGNPSSTGRRTRTPDESAAWTPSRAPGSGTGTCAASMDGSGAAWRIPEGS